MNQSLNLDDFEMAASVLDGLGESATRLRSPSGQRFQAENPKLHEVLAQRASALDAEVNESIARVYADVGVVRDRLFTLQRLAGDLYVAVNAAIAEHTS